jgi:hypothetical protein
VVINGHSSTPGNVRCLQERHSHNRALCEHQPTGVLLIETRELVPLNWSDSRAIAGQVKARTKPLLVRLITLQQIPETRRGDL